MPKSLKEIKNEKPAVKIAKKPEVILTTSEISQRVLNKAEQMKVQLESQPKVSILIPLEKGEKKGAVQPFCINGYRMTVPKGRMVQVPEQVAQMISERFDVELDLRGQSLSNSSKEARSALNAE